MKTSLQYLFILLLIFGMPLLTSWALDIDWISRHWTRRGMIYLLMLLQIVLGSLMLHQVVRTNKTKKQ
jgi:hypothetical protein